MKQTLKRLTMIFTDQKKKNKSKNKNNNQKKKKKKKTIKHFQKQGNVHIFENK